MWTVVTTVTFLLFNAGFVFYGATIVPSLTENSPTLVQFIAAGMLCLGGFQFLWFILLGGVPDYGKFGNSKPKHVVPIRWAWITMEQPAVVIPSIALLEHVTRGRPFAPGVVPLLMFMTHYFHRSYIYSFRTRGQPFPTVAWACALVFCSLNGTMQTIDLLHGGGDPVAGWASVWSPRACLGYALFISGMVTNIHSDNTLRNLRKPGEVGYKIPRGGMFEYVSGANFFGECLEWTGYWIACDPSGGHCGPMAFALYNWSGIGMRCIATHEWYVTKFRD
eukprot:CAMPEP_0194524762 /NCGR_PEP_ID=MMETSP0253-20130528/60047_1 /TAXON_ID=2966 /ORGANISM="Noctiluca scintillans" /LENGTH=277 /DNA_ID=CAMNT_0039369421 /DNA_START=9 /DNA_END=839 /DNA_ORIENTATION=-